MPVRPQKTRGPDEGPADATGGGVVAPRRVRQWVARGNKTLPARPFQKNRRGAALGVSSHPHSSEAPGALRPWAPIARGRPQPQRSGAWGTFARPLNGE